MSEPFVGEIRMFAGTFAPRGWAFCDGQLLGVAQNDALFSLLGTTYGGDGRTTFGLPDLRGRVAVHPGTGPGLDNVRIGERGGREIVPGATTTVSSGFTTERGVEITSHSNQGALPSSNGNQMDDGLCINYIISLLGIYPSRA